MNKWLLLLGALLVLGLTGGSVSKVERLREAIARAEGWYVEGSRPQRNNNPGNLTKDFGYPITGHDGPFPIFLTPEWGWTALRNQVEMMLDGSSAYYDPYMTIREVAEKYTETEKDAWAQNVASQLGVTVDTRLADI